MQLVKQWGQDLAPGLFNSKAHVPPTTCTASLEGEQKASGQRATLPRGCPAFSEVVSLNLLLTSVFNL